MDGYIERTGAPQTRVGEAAATLIDAISAFESLRAQEQNGTNVTVVNGVISGQNLRVVGAVVSGGLQGVIAP